MGTGIALLAPATLPDAIRTTKRSAAAPCGLAADLETDEDAMLTPPEFN
jgi:hypothetical protein